MKKNNPHIPIMLREALGVEPKVYARYGLSIAKTVSRVEVRLKCNHRVWKGETGVVIRYGLLLLELVYMSQHAKIVSQGLNDREIEDSVTGLVKTGI